MKYYRLILASLLITITGCSSVDFPDGPSVEEVYNQGGSGLNDSKTRIDALRKGMIPNPRFSISDPMMPIVRPPLSFPVYIRGERSRYFQEEGRWVHEIVDPGGYIN